LADDFMKSALDRAMERADRIQVPEEKLQEMHYQGEGKRLAANFLKEPGYDLQAALQACDPVEQKQIAGALVSILLQNLVLVKKESDISSNNRVLEGIGTLKKDKQGIEQAKEQLENLSNYYSQARAQHYEQLKSQVSQALSQQIRQQTGAAPSGNLNVEQRPEFQENWRKLSAQLDGEYDKALIELKNQIASLR